MGKPTPGPWKYGELSGDVLAGTETVCTMPVLEAETSQEQELLANARLISAAPDLLAACELVLAYFGEDWMGGVTERAALRAAIAKAVKP